MIYECSTVVYFLIFRLKFQHKMINDLTKMYKDQRWLVAHNAWNTNQWPDYNNQMKTITELLDYGVRGFALDIYGSEENSLHLQHGHANDATSIKWSIIANEIATWMNKSVNKNEVVSLFFESYLKGPKTPGEQTALTGLQNSLVTICGNFYIPGKTAQLDALNTKTLQQLVDGEKDSSGIVITKPQRLFAFLEKEPDEGTQDLFPVMIGVFAENDYGDPSLKMGKWVNLRDNSSYTNGFTFMNHFGNRPTGSEWNRNNPELIEKHANAFVYAYGGRYPNFISLDKINWKDNDLTTGPIIAINNLQQLADVLTSGFKWDDRNGCDNYEYSMIPDGMLTSLSVETAKGKGIVKIIPVFAMLDPLTPNAIDNLSYIDAIQLVNVAKHGAVNLRYRIKGGNWGNWLTPFEQLTDPNDANLATHEASSPIVGICARLGDGYGVTDFAIAFKK